MIFVILVLMVIVYTLILHPSSNGMEMLLSGINTFIQWSVVILALLFARMIYDYAVLNNLL